MKERIITKKQLSMFEAELRGKDGQKPGTEDARQGEKQREIRRREVISYLSKMARDG